MCLSTVIKNNIPKRQHGWKVFTIIHSRLYPQYMDSIGGAYKVNTWIKNPRVFPIFPNDCWESRSDYYYSGFHFYRYKKDAIRNCGLYETVRKVLAKNITAYGKQDDTEVFVCQEMLIKGV